MPRWKVRTDQKGVPYPKHKRIASKPRKKAEIPESTLQAIADLHLSRFQVFNFRIPDDLGSAIIWKLPIHMKAMYSDSLGGFPDNLCLIPISGKYCLAIALENKTTIGKLHGKQKVVSKEIPFVIPRTEQEIERVIMDFIEAADKLKGLTML